MHFLKTVFLALIFACHVKAQHIPLEMRASNAARLIPGSTSESADEMDQGVDYEVVLREVLKILMILMLIILAAYNYHKYMELRQKKRRAARVKQTKQPHFVVNVEKH